jgi:hypothetical protein
MTEIKENQANSSSKKFEYSCHHTNSVGPPTLHGLLSYPLSSTQHEAKILHECLSLQAQRELLQIFPQKTNTAAILGTARNKADFITNCTYPVRIHIWFT